MGVKENAGQKKRGSPETQKKPPGREEGGKEGERGGERRGGESGLWYSTKKQGGKQRGYERLHGESLETRRRLLARAKLSV